MSVRRLAMLVMVVAVALGAATGCKPASPSQTTATASSASGAAAVGKPAQGNWCPKLPATYDISGVAKSVVFDLPPLNTLPPWRSPADSERHATQLLCLIVGHTRGVSAAQLAALPPLQPSATGCPDDTTDVWPFYYCKSRNVFLFVPSPASSNVGTYDQLATVAMGVLAVQGWFVSRANLGASDAQAFESLMACAAGRIFGGLLADKVITAQYEQRLVTTRADIDLYNKVRDGQSCNLP